MNDQYGWNERARNADRNHPEVLYAIAPYKYQPIIEPASVIPQTAVRKAREFVNATHGDKLSANTWSRR
jgi:hypothetical protein